MGFLHRIQHLEAIKVHRLTLVFFEECLQFGDDIIHR